MESLSPSQIRDINSLYKKMYEPEDDLVEGYFEEDQIRSAIAYEIFTLTESHDHFSDDQLSAVIDILTEMNLNMQKAEQSISKIIGEDISLTGRALVLEEIEEKDLNENILNRFKPLIGLVDKARKRKGLVKFASDTLAKVPFSKYIANPTRKPGTFRQALTKVGSGFVGKMVDDATGKNVQSALVNTLHGTGGALKSALDIPFGFFRGYTNKDKK